MPAEIVNFASAIFGNMSGVNTSEQMKRQKNRQRFYLWDYLWWHGERWQQVRQSSKIDGELMLSLYIFALIIFPMMIVTVRLFPAASSPLMLAVCLPVMLAAMSLAGRIYRQRGKAVMRHYAWHGYHEVISVLLFFLSITIIIFQMWLFDK